MRLLRARRTDLAALREDVAERIAAGSTVAVKLGSEGRQQLATLLDKLLT